MTNTPKITKKEEWFVNGQLMYQQFYKDGKPEGEWKGWWENGQPRYQIFCRDGNREGEQFWDMDGILEYQDDIIRKR